VSAQTEALQEWLCPGTAAREISGECCSPFCVSAAMQSRGEGWKARPQKNRKIIAAADERQQKVLLLHEARGDDWLAECTTKLQPVRDWLRQRGCKVACDAAACTAVVVYWRRGEN
jgi:hypothetical protein